MCGARGNACGALVVSRHGCAPAMPTPIELDYFLQQAAANPERIRRPDLDSTLAHLHRVTVPRPRWEELYIFAFDHRSQVARAGSKSRGSGEQDSRAKEVIGRGGSLRGARED